MNQKPGFVIFALTVIVLLSGCTKPAAPNNNNQAPGPTNAFYATVDGVYWGSDSTNGFVNTDPSTNRVTILIGANKRDGSGFSIGMPGGITPGTYTMDPSFTYGIIYGGPQGVFQSSTGKLVVTSNTNKVVTGTYECTMVPVKGSGSTGTVSVTNGGYKVAY